VVNTAMDQTGTGPTHDDGPAELRRQELAGFLRSRRERISPDQVGLPPGGRRRTPGLRREEVAQLAGVGVTWYTWLEQGREINASEQVLESIGRVLMLDAHERSHLFTLSGAPLPSFDEACQGLPTEVPTLLEKLHPYPAAVTNGRFDLLAYNQAYRSLVGDLDALPFDQRNTLWLMLTSPVLRLAMLDWDEAVRRLVGQFRANMADHVAEPPWKCLVNRLEAASPEFAELWGHHEVVAPENLVKRILHPELGLLRLNYTNLWLAQRMAVRMVTYTPADGATREALARIDEVVPRPLFPSVEALSVGGMLVGHTVGAGAA
jgi:transcriptional regulator with XRE-family HTH domain